MTTPTNHQPVLIEKVVELLDPKPAEVYLDLTAGYGGHAAEIAAKTKPQVSDALVLVDRDHEAILALNQHFSRAKIVHSDFDQASQDLEQAGFQADLILMDLGVSSLQLDKSDRGFSFRQAGPLDMRMDSRAEPTADQIVNHYKEQEIAQILWELGEERFSRRIAKAIVSTRPIYDTAQLAAIIAKTIPGKRGRIHPATRSFQGIRMAVNDELGQIERTLPRLPKLLKPGGRVVIISFHSLEDRLIKNFFKAEPRLSVLTKKPLAGSDFDKNNPRARSAKLRAAVKQT